MELKEYLENDFFAKTGSRTSIPEHYRTEISTYKRVEENDYKGRKWYKVYYAGTDCKYCAFMVSPDTKEVRDMTMSEFYGGAVVD